MFRREGIRRFLVVLVAIALPAALTLLPGADPSIVPHQDAAIAAKATLSRAPVAPADVRPLALAAVLTAGMAAAAMLRRARCGRNTPGREGRLTDVGDDWRALLIGAPPAAGRS